MRQEAQLPRIFTIESEYPKPTVPERLARRMLAWGMIPINHLPPPHGARFPSHFLFILSHLRVLLEMGSPQSPHFNIGRR